MVCARPNPRRQAHPPQCRAMAGRGIKEARARARVTLGQIRVVVTRSRKRTAQAEREARLAEPTVAERLEQWQRARRTEWSRRYAEEVARLCAKEIEPRLGRRPLSATSAAGLDRTRCRQASVGPPAPAPGCSALYPASSITRKDTGGSRRRCCPGRGARDRAAGGEPSPRSVGRELQRVWQATTRSGRRAGPMSDFRS